MARVPEITERSQILEAQQVIYDEITASRGRVAGPFPVLLNSPEMALQVARIGHHVRFNHELDPKVFEVIVLCAAREFDCLFEWAAHARAAEQAGVRPEVIAAIRNRTAPVGLSEQEQVIFHFVHELATTHRISPAHFDAAKAWLGDKGVVDLAATIGYYALLACVMDAAEVQPPPGADVLPVP
jgi:4-carboxymuconolactone decarboxylase